MTARHPLASAALRKTSNVALWALQVLLAAAFVGAGSGKLLGAPETVALFDAIGVGQWFRHVTGVLEVLGAFLLVVPGLAAGGAVLLGVVMACASVAHLTVLDAPPTVPLVLLAFSALIAWARRSQLARASRPARPLTTPPRASASWPRSTRSAGRRRR